MKCIQLAVRQALELKQWLIIIVIVITDHDCGSFACFDAKLVQKYKCLIDWSRINTVDSMVKRNVIFTLLSFADIFR